MKESYIILHRPAAIDGDLHQPRSRSRGLPGSPFAEGLDLPEPESRGMALNFDAMIRADVDELTPREAARVAGMSGVQAIAPEFALKLIEPVDLPEPMPDVASASVSWGIPAVGADRCPYSGQGITAAVLDTGIDAGHPAFEGVTLLEKDFTGKGNGDTDGHGTHCAGTIFGRDVGGQRIGVARGINRALIGKVLAPGAGSTKAIIPAIQWAVSEGAHVISMSLGMDFPTHVANLENRGYPTQLAVTKALNAYRLTVNLFQDMATLLASWHQSTGGACILVAASGNESRRTSDPNTSFEIEASPPAVSRGFICVGALEQAGDRLRVAPYSNYNCNIVAPGTGVLSAKAGSRELVTKNGTSMATPHVAGVAALWAEQLATTGMLSTYNVQARLTGSATPEALAPGSKPADYGLGLVRAPLPVPGLG